MRVHSPVSGMFSSTTLPVARLQVGAVMSPIPGEEGVTGCRLIITSAEAGDTHPAAFVTVNVYVPGGIADTVRVTPVPGMVTLPGVLVSVHVPVSGSPLSSTLPVERAQVGCTIVPTIGATGVSGCVLITTFDDDADTHPLELVTVKVYVPGARPVIVVLVPDPVEVWPPGVRVIVQSPDPGRLLSTTLPVGSVHVGWVLVPGTGAVGRAFTVSV